MSKSSDMSSSLTFGPEWLRALSGGNSGDGEAKPQKSPRRFKLAEFRYGREEMLALFSGNFKMPQELKDFGDVILAETPCEPLSFIPLSEEEERCQVAGVNSSVVLRMSGRGMPTRGRGAMRGARGGGRGRGDGAPGYYRSLSSEDGYNSNRDSYNRRPWNEGARGGSTDRGGGRGGGDISPGRGGYEHRPRIPSDRSGSTEREVWREDEDGGGWRVSGQRSWRKGSADASKNWRSDHNKEEDSPDQLPRSRSWNRPTNEREDHIWRQHGSSSNSGLPEWCEDDGEDDLGTFDSSGQFRSFKHGESEKPGEDHDKPVFEVGDGRESDTEPVKKQTVKEHTDSKEEDKTKTEIRTIKTTGIEGNNITTKTTSPKPVEANNQRPVAISVADLEKELTRETETSNVNKNSNHVVDSKTNDLIAEINKLVSTSSSETKKYEHLEKNDIADEADGISMDHIKNLLDKLDDEHDDPLERPQFASPNQEIDQNIDPSILFAKKAEPGVLIKGMQDWIYRDPQGEIQGPFSNEEMLEWFKAGYFTMGLLVRRVCDEVFLPLGDAIKLWNRVPFLPGAAPPSITSQRLAMLQRSHRQQAQYQRLLAQQQQQQQQQQQHELRLVEKLQKQQQVEDLHQRPHNLNVGQDVSIWGDSPSQSPNLASTPWSPSVSQPEPAAWSQTKSPTSDLTEMRKLEDEKQKTENDAVLEKIKRDVEDDDARRQQAIDDQRPKKTEESKSKENEKRKQTEKDPQGSQESSPDAKPKEVKSPSDEDSKKEVSSSKKGAEKKKKQEVNKKQKAERERQQQREEEQRKALEALEKQQQQKQAMQKKKEEETKQRQFQQEQQQQQLLEQEQQQKMLEQQQQQKMLEQQQQQQFLLKQQQQQKLEQQKMQMMMLQQQLQQQESMQQESRRHVANDGPSWNVPVSSSAPSLAEIQRMEEQRQMAIREKLQQIKAQEQRMQQQQRAAAGWGDKGGKPVASLRQIQEEEARQLLARQRNQQHQMQQHQAKMNHSAMPSSAWNAKGQQTQQQNYAPYETSNAPSFWDDVMSRGPSLETSNQIQRNNPKSRSVSDSSFPSLSTAPKQNKKTKDEEFVRRLFHKSSPSEDFIQWVNKNLPAIGKLVDVATFVQFLQEVNSPYEVYEYIRSYFGDSQDAQTFAREFLEWRKNNSKSQTSFQTAVSESGMMPVNNDLTSPEGDDPNGKRKKQKKKMQKVNPSLLGFSCNADPDLINRGEIQSAMDAWNLK